MKGTTMEVLISRLAERAREANPPKNDDYIDEDGLLRCGKCGKRKEKVVDFTKSCGRFRVVPVSCDCTEKRRAEERAAEWELTLNARREQLGISRADRFETSEMTPELEKCRRYVEHWHEAQAKNIGLLLWGDFSTGKTHAAHCICNALLERNRTLPPENAKTEPPVFPFVTSISSTLSGNFDKTETLANIRERGLVVIDDLGTERGSDYALEVAFTMIDARYQVKKPLIVTTNLTLTELRNPVLKDPKRGELIPDMRRKRIYNRVLEMCVPVCFHGKPRHTEKKTEKQSTVAEWLA